MDREKIIKKSLKFPGFKNQEKLIYLAEIASLAPSSHNTQPWLFKILETQNAIEIWPNLQRHLQASDAEKRELYLSLGALIGSLKLASDFFSLPYTQTYFGSMDANLPVFKIVYEDLNTKFLSDSANLKNLIYRHCNRYDFSDGEIPAKLKQKVMLLNKPPLVIFMTTDQEKMSQLASVVLKSVDKAFKTKGFTDELSQWIKPSLKTINDGMPGYNIGIPWILSFLMPWAIKNVPMSDAQVKMNRKMLENCSAYVTICTESDEIQDRLLAGEAFLRLAVQAEEDKVQLSVFGAPIEIGENYKLFQKILETTARPQIFFRLGFTKKRPGLSPRLPITDLLMQ